jgi:hypothetical protein
MLMLIAAPLALTACLGSTGADVLRPAPPPSLTAPCPHPVRLPERELTQAEVERFWGRDRSALRACGGQVEGLAEWVAGE